MIEKAKSKTIQKNQVRSVKKEKELIAEASRNIMIKMPEAKKKFDFGSLNNFYYSKFLMNVIDTDTIYNTKFLNKIELMNGILSDYLIKKRINVRDIEIKIKSEETRKEKESLMIRKNLEDKMDAVLQKVNSTLEGVKNLGRKGKGTSLAREDVKQTVNIKSKRNNSTNQISDKIQLNGKNNSNNNQILLKTNPNEMATLVSKLNNKYNEVITVNNSNLKNYFSMIARNKTALKDLKDSNKRLKIKSKGMKDIFSVVYKNNSSVNKKVKQVEMNFNSQIYQNLNTNFQALSIINTPLFDKLFIKVFFEIDINSKIRDDDIYDIFSFWYYIKNIKNVLESKGSSPEDSGSSKQDNIELERELKEKGRNKENLFIDHYIVSNLNRYFTNLFNKVKKKETGEIKEEEIFNKDFYTFYDSLLKIHKIKYIRLIIENLENIQLKITPTNQQREELLYLRSVYSLILNNGTYSYQICKK